jgi:hypothetical protein
MMFTGAAGRLLLLALPHQMLIPECREQMNFNGA